MTEDATRVEVKRTRPLTKRGAVLWLGGVQFGGSLAAARLLVDLFFQGERYFPLWPPAWPVYYYWLVSLVVVPLLCFGVGCLLGLFIWKYFGERTRSPAPRVNTGGRQG